MYDLVELQGRQLEFAAQRILVCLVQVESHQHSTISRRPEVAQQPLDALRNLRLRNLLPWLACAGDGVQLSRPRAPFGPISQHAPLVAQQVHRNLKHVARHLLWSPQLPLLRFLQRNTDCIVEKIRSELWITSPVCNEQAQAWVLLRYEPFQVLPAEGGSGSCVLLRSIARVRVAALSSGCAGNHQHRRTARLLSGIPDCADRLVTHGVTDIWVNFEYVLRTH
jgi:hypothetical protein